MGISDEVLRQGLGMCRKLMELGFKPYILGSAWLRLKQPKFDILIPDVDVFCPNFVPEEFPVPIDMVQDGGKQGLYSFNNRRFEISTILHGVRFTEEDLMGVGVNGVPCVSNDLWMATSLTKIANYLSKRLGEPDFPLRYMSAIPLANCYLFNLSGMGFSPERVAWMLGEDRFTHSRVFHLYNTDVSYIAAFLVSRYHHVEGNWISPDEIVIKFYDEVIKPIASIMGVFPSTSPG